MISGIVAHGKYVYVHGGFSNCPYVNMSLPNAGSLRWNIEKYVFEIYDGQSWMTFNGSHSMLGLNDEAENILDWAKEKMLEERQWLELAKTNNAVRIAFNNYNDSRRKLETLTSLVESTK